MKLYPIIFLLALLILPMAIAEDYEYDILGTFKQSTCIQLIQTCPNCTFVNISSVTYPDSTQALGLVEMQRAGTFYNYTFCKTAQLGTYRVSGYGDINNVQNYYETFTYVFIITPTLGSESNTTTFLFLIIGATLLIILGFAMKNEILSLIAGFLFLASGMYGMIYGFGDTTNTYTRIISLMVIALGALITLASAFNFLEDMDLGKKDGEDDFESD
jgi:hypothetical protein